MLVKNLCPSTNQELRFALRRFIDVNQFIVYIALLEAGTTKNWIENKISIKSLKDKIQKKTKQSLER